MKKISFFITILLSIYSQAQENKSFFDEFGAQIGFALSSRFDLTNEEWTTIQAENFVPDKDSSFTVLRNTNTNFSPNVQLYLGKTIGTIGSSKFTHGLRIGFGHFGFQREEIKWIKTEHFTIDTLISQQTQTKIPIDSIRKHEYHKKLNLDSYRIQLNYLIRSNDEKNISFYTGFGFGGIIHSSIFSNYEENLTLRYSPISVSNPTDKTPIENNVNLQNSKLKRAFGYQYEIPFGVDFRLKSKDESLKKSSIGVNLTYGQAWSKFNQFETMTVRFFRLGLNVRVLI
jgi:hypothetical protein